MSECFARALWQAWYPDDGKNCWACGERSRATTAREEKLARLAGGDESLRAEVERLKANYNNERNEWRSACDQRDKARHEVERLKRELAAETASTDAEHANLVRVSDKYRSCEDELKRALAAERQARELLSEAGTVLDLAVSDDCDVCGGYGPATPVLDKIRAFLAPAPGAVDNQQAALPAAGGACCEKGAKLKEEWVSRYKCPTHGWQVARTVPPPPVSGSPQAGEGRPPKQDCVHGRYNCELCSWVTGLPGELVESVATNTPGSPPVDPSDPTKGEPT